MSDEILQVGRSSIEVNQNAKKDYSFSVKIYFEDAEDFKKSILPAENTVISRIEKIYEELHNRFKDGK